MLEPIDREEQPHPIRRAAANLHEVQRYVSEQDALGADLATLDGILMSLDRSVRAVGAATHVEDFWTEARGLVKHAQTVVKLREKIEPEARQVLLPPMQAAHDALLEAADLLTNTDELAAPF